MTERELDVLEQAIALSKQIYASEEKERQANIKVITISLSIVLSITIICFTLLWVREIDSSYDYSQEISVTNEAKSASE